MLSTRSLLVRTAGTIALTPRNGGGTVARLDILATVNSAVG